MRRSLDHQGEGGTVTVVTAMNGGDDVTGPGEETIPGTGDEMVRMRGGGEIMTGRRIGGKILESDEGGRTLRNEERGNREREVHEDGSQVPSVTARETEDGRMKRRSILN